MSDNVIPKVIDIPVTPEEIAKVFAYMDNHEQARFFNEVVNQSKTWKGTHYSLQLQLRSIAESPELSEEALDLLVSLGEEAKQTHKDMITQRIKGE